MKRANGQGGLSKGGYWRITVSDGRRMFEHRYVIEQNLGRKLTATEKVHHIDGNKLNNTLSNLEVCTQAQHLSYHRQSLIDGRDHDGLKIVDWSNYQPPQFREFRNQIVKCLIEHCPRQVKTWGLCNRHAVAYHKWRKSRQ